MTIVQVHFGETISQSAQPLGAHINRAQVQADGKLFTGDGDPALRSFPHTNDMFVTSKGTKIHTGVTSDTRTSKIEQGPEVYVCPLMQY